MKEELLQNIRQELLQQAEDHTKKSSQRFFKEKVIVFGVKTAVVQKISKKYFQLIKNLDKEEIYHLCEALWKTGYVEESVIACNWSYFLHKRYTLPDFPVFEKWINEYVNNWATCDTFCNHTVGEFIEMYPESIKKLKYWAKSNNRWMRRAAAVSLIVPARKGMFLDDVFDIADILLLDHDDMVQKGYGWMLKVASKLHQKKVFDYVYKNKDVMPRTSLRYAIEKMPPDLRKKAMVK